MQSETNFSYSFGNYLKIIDIEQNFWKYVINI